MRCYSIERSTMEWGHILKQIANGNQPIRKVEVERRSTLLDDLIRDIEQALEHDDNHWHGKGIELPERMERR